MNQTKLIKTISSKIIISDDTVYLPLCDIINYLNYNIEFKEEDNILSINKNITVNLNEWLNNNTEYKDVLTVYTLEEARE